MSSKSTCYPWRW